MPVAGLKDLVGIDESDQLLLLKQFLMNSQMASSRCQIRSAFELAFVTTSLTTVQVEKSESGFAHESQKDHKQDVRALGSKKGKTTEVATEVHTTDTHGEGEKLRTVFQLGATQNKHEKLHERNARPVNRHTRAASSSSSSLRRTMND